MQDTTKESGRLNSILGRRLPYPTEKPTSHLVIFDGKCLFCTSQIRMLYRTDFTKSLSFISLHDPLVLKWFPSLTYDQLMKQIYVIPNFDSKTGASNQAPLPAEQGIRFLFLRNPLYFPVGLLLSIPFSGKLWNNLYHQIAKRRYLMGKVNTDSENGGCEEGGTCHLHFGENKEAGEGNKPNAGQKTSDGKKTVEK